MIIKKFNESTTDFKKLWCVVIRDEESYLYSSGCFTSEILAADYLIKYVNSKFNQEFEPFFDKDGNRFFTNLNENEDYEKCVDYCYEVILPEHYKEIKIIETELYSNPKI